MNFRKEITKFLISIYLINADILLLKRHGEKSLESVCCYIVKTTIISIIITLVSYESWVHPGSHFYLQINNNPNDSRLIYLHTVIALLTLFLCSLNFCNITIFSCGISQ